MATYNPYSSIKNIYDLKKKYEDAYKVGDKNTYETAAGDAAKCYQQLKDNGYGNVAEKLSKTNYEGAKSIHDSYATAGKTAIRPYFEQLANANGINAGDVNKLINYNNTTGRVSFAGTDIGTPDALVDGTSYWDKNYLKGVFDSYLKESKANDYNGVKGNATYTEAIDNAGSRSKQQWDELTSYNKDMNNKQNEAWGVATTPVTQSEEYINTMKYMMPYYVTSGNRLADGAVASSAASSSGNVDTFAAANAVRQRNAQIAQGMQTAHQMGLESFQTRMNNINNLLTTMGANRASLSEQQNANITNEMARAQQAFDSGETQRMNDHTMSEASKNNKVEREATLSDITGTVSPYAKYVGILYDEEGNLLPNLDNVDVQALINDVDAKIKTATTDEEKASLQETRNMLLQARILKVYNDMGKWGQYASTLEMPTAEPTASYKLAQDTLSQETAASMAETAQKQQEAAMENQLAYDKMANERVIQAMKSGVTEDGVVGDNTPKTVSEFDKINGDLLIGKSSTDKEERSHSITGYPGLNNLSARFINEVLASGNYSIDQGNGKYTINEADVLKAINEKSDAYGLKLADAEAILEYLGMNNLKQYLEERAYSQTRNGVPGVATTK